MNVGDPAPFVYPALEVVHIVGIALLVAALWCSRCASGASAGDGARPLARLACRSLSLWGFGLAAASGWRCSSPDECWPTRAFVVKMGLSSGPGSNALASSSRRRSRRRPAARLQTAFSLGLWLAVVVCGRWIAYK